MDERKQQQSGGTTTDQNSALAGPAAPPTDAPNSGRFRLWTVNEILALENPEWLIDGVMEVGAQGVIYGPSGEGKSFVALDWALSVATGRAWQRRATKRGPVVYVVAEGSRSIRKRVAAWKQESSATDIDNAFFVLEAVQLRQRDDYAALASRLDRLGRKPSLIVLDTLARCFVGGDENASKDVGEFVDASRRLHEHTGAAILLVHHTGKDGNAERGSSALRAAADVMFRVSQGSEGLIRIENDKQKDEEECSDHIVRLKPVQLDADSLGRQLTSCVLVAAGSKAPSKEPGLSAPLMRALATLGDLEGPVSSGRWQAALQESKDGEDAIPLRTFQNWRSALVKRGLVERDPERKTYRLTAKGHLARLGMPVDSEPERPLESASHATTPIGVAGGHEGSRGASLLERKTTRPPFQDFLDNP
jgi:hypothetical protein